MQITCNQLDLIDSIESTLICGLDLVEFAESEEYFGPVGLAMSERVVEIAAPREALQLVEVQVPVVAKRFYFKSLAGKIPKLERPDVCSQGPPVGAVLASNYLLSRVEG